MEQKKFWSYLDNNIGLIWILFKTFFIIGILRICSPHSIYVYTINSELSKGVILWDIAWFFIYIFIAFQFLRYQFNIYPPYSKPAEIDISNQILYILYACILIIISNIALNLLLSPQFKSGGYIISIFYYPTILFIGYLSLLIRKNSVQSRELE